MWLVKDLDKAKQKKSILLFFFLIFTTLLTLKTFKKVNFQNIRIYGSDYFSKEEIINNSSLNLPTRLIFIKTKYAEKELKKNLSLKNVSINRQIIPFGLSILIKTRIPIAYGEKTINGAQISGFIDENGFFISEKFTNTQNIKKLPTKVFGWTENFKGTLSKILKSQKNNEVEFTIIRLSKNGFLTLDEKSLKTILLGFNQKIIDSQLEIINDIKKQLDQTNVLKKIDNIDLTDPKKPIIKVFKP